MSQTETLTPAHQTNSNELVQEPLEYAYFGENHRWAKLDAAKVREIRRLHAEDGISYSALGRQFGVGYTTIRAVITRKTWKHI